MVVLLRPPFSQGPSRPKGLTGLFIVASGAQRMKLKQILGFETLLSGVSIPFLFPVSFLVVLLLPWSEIAVPSPSLATVSFPND